MTKSGFVFALAFSSLASQAQLTSSIVGAPATCRSNGVQLTYTIQSRLTNNLTVPLTVERIPNLALQFYVFKDQSTTDRDRALWKWEPEYMFGLPPRKKRKLKPGQTVAWTTTAFVLAQEEGIPREALAPGDNFLWPLNDLILSLAHGDPPKGFATPTWLPIHIPAYPAVYYGRLNTIPTCYEAKHRRKK